MISRGKPIYKYQAVSKKELIKRLLHLANPVRNDTVWYVIGPNFRGDLKQISNHPNEEEAKIEANRLNNPVL